MNGSLLITLAKSDPQRQAHAFASRVSKIFLLSLNESGQGHKSIFSGNPETVFKNIHRGGRGKQTSATDLRSFVLDV